MSKTIRSFSSAKQLKLPFLLCYIGFLLVAFSGRGMAHSEFAAPSQTIPPADRVTKTLTRSVEPIILTGKEAPRLLANSIEQIAAFRLHHGEWERIQIQIDEVDQFGNYVSYEDGAVDLNDEVVFMAMDVGDRVSASALASTPPPATDWFQVTITDPLAPTEQGWVYIAISDWGWQPLSTDYIDFDIGRHRIMTPAYSFGLGVTHPGAEHLILGDSGVEILDRTKLSIDCNIIGLCPFSENNQLLAPDHLIKDGPIRVLLRGGRLVAYQSMISWTMDYIFSSAPTLISFDFNEAVHGATLYNAATPNGITVDGIPDVVPALPFSPWWQLNTPHGSLVYLIDTALPDEDLVNYYLDDATYDPTDTGDRQHHGEIGVRYSGTEPISEYRFHLYFPPQTNGSVGETFSSYSDNSFVLTIGNRGLQSEASEVHTTYIPVFSTLLQPGSNFGDFYEDVLGTDANSGSPGEILRVEHIRNYTPDEIALAAGIPESPYGALAYRVLYHSQDENNAAQVVSGLLVIPSSNAEADNKYPVLVHANNVPDLADRCAPSKGLGGVWNLLPWVAEGYIVTATDFAGLGTSGERSLLVGPNAAKNLLDSARVVYNFFDADRGIMQPIAEQAIFFAGHSIGTHGILYAMEMKEQYAPELNLLGTILFSPVADLQSLVSTATLPPSATMAPLLLTMSAYSEYYGSPDDPHEWLKEPYASQLQAKLSDSCVVGIAAWAGVNPDKVFQLEWLSAVREERWGDLQPWSQYLQTNTLESFSSPYPVLIIHGQADALVPPDSSVRLQADLCRNNVPTQLTLYQGLGHVNILRAGRTEAIKWMSDIQDGKQSNDLCAE